MKSKVEYRSAVLSEDRNITMYRITVASTVLLRDLLKPSKYFNAR